MSGFLIHCKCSKLNNKRINEWFKTRPRTNHCPAFLYIVYAVTKYNNGRVTSDLKCGPGLLFCFLIHVLGHTYKSPVTSPMVMFSLLHLQCIRKQDISPGPHFKSPVTSPIVMFSLLHLQCIRKRDISPGPHFKSPVTSPIVMFSLLHLQCIRKQDISPGPHFKSPVTSPIVMFSYCIYNV